MILNIFIRDKNFASNDKKTEKEQLKKLLEKEDHYDHYVKVLGPYWHKRHLLHKGQGKEKQE